MFYSWVNLTGLKASAIGFTAADKRWIFGGIMCHKGAVLYSKYARCLKMAHAGI